MLQKITHTFSYKLLIVLANFLVVAITSRTLGSEGRGETNLFLTDFSIIYLFSGIVAGTTISFFSGKKDLFTMCVLGYGWSVMTSMAGTFILGIIHTTPHSLWLAGISLIQSFTMTNQMILLGKDDLKTYNWNTAVQPISHFAFIAVAQIMNIHLSVELFVLSFFFSSALAFLLSFLPIQKHLTAYRLVETRKTFEDLLKYGIRSNYDNIVETLNYRAGIYCLFWFGYAHAVGELSNSIALAEGTWLISNSLALVLYSHSLQSDDLKAQQALTLSYAKLCFLGTSAALLLLISIPDSLYVILFGNDFQDLVYYIILLAPGVAFLATSNVIGHYLAAKGEYTTNNIRSTLGLILVIMLLLLLLPRLGKKGAAIATSASYFLSSLYLIFYFFKTSKIRFREIFTWSDLKELWHTRNK